MDGRGAADMLYNRIGFCMLHPWRGAARLVLTRGETPSGTRSRQRCRGLIAPQRFEKGAYVPAVSVTRRRLEIELERAAARSLEFDGDLFETEDQRNWTDASFKTYCTPLALGFPHELTDGERTLAQAVTVSTRADSRRPTRDRRHRCHCTSSIGEAAGGPRVVSPWAWLWPAGRTCCTAAAELALLRELGPAHVRYELHSGSRWTGARI